MSADFWSSYASGAIGILIGNRLDILKTELQAGNRIFVSTQLLDHSEPTKFRALTSLLRGAAAPVVGYGALNSILFMTYNRSLKVLDPSIFDYNKLAGVDLGKIWVAGAVGGLACWVVSTPSEIIKCRAQLVVDGRTSSYETAADIWRRSGIRGFYLGGTITSIRDSIGYAWYFWTYELTKRLILSRQPDPFAEPNAADVLMAGGIAGVVTWASIYPLDVVKTRMQTQSAESLDTRLLQTGDGSASGKTSWSIAKDIARIEGIRGLYRGLAVCSLRAFIVNAIQVGQIRIDNEKNLRIAVLCLRRNDEDAGHAILTLSALPTTLPTLVCMDNIQAPQERDADATSALFLRSIRTNSDNS